MPQKFKSIRSAKTIKMHELSMGQLGEIVGDNEYTGIVVVRCYIGYVAVYGNKENTAFYCCWSSNPTMEVRLLEPGESVELSN